MDRYLHGRITLCTPILPVTVHRTIDCKKKKKREEDINETIPTPIGLIRLILNCRVVVPNALLLEHVVDWRRAP